MFSMKSAFIICFDSIASWKKTPRVYLGFLLGIAFAIYPTVNYLQYSMAISEPVNILEPFIILGSRRDLMTILVLGLLFVLSNAPFVTQQTTYSIIRMSRMSWGIGCIIYIIITTLTYYLIILLFTAVVSLQNGFILNIWSHPMYVISQLQPYYTVKLYDIHFASANIAKQMLPVSATLYTLLLSACYSITLSIIMFIVNLYKNRIIGSVVAILIHLAGVVMISEEIMYRPKYSLLANALLGSHNLYDNSSFIMTIEYSLLIFFSLIILLIIMLKLLIKRVDYRVYFGTRE